MRMAMTKTALATMMTMAMAVGCDGASTEPVGGGLETAPAGAGDETVSSTTTGVDETGKAITICVNRADRRATITPTGGNWGTWASCASFCPDGSFAYGFSHRSEASRGVGDDTALNGIRLNCNNRTTGAWTANVTSSQGGWGSWLGVGMCPQNSLESPLTQGNVQLESSQGIGDDTAANRMSGSCRLGGANVDPPSNTSWGTWRGWNGCPSGTAVCGIRTRVEGSQGTGDDTALNGVQLECCAFCPIGQTACGANGECLVPSACPPPPVIR